MDLRAGAWSGCDVMICHDMSWFVIGSWWYGSTSLVPLLLLSWSHVSSRLWQEVKKLSQLSHINLVWNWVHDVHFQERCAHAWVNGFMCRIEDSTEYLFRQTLMRSWRSVTRVEGVRRVGHLYYWIHMSSSATSLNMLELGLPSVACGMANWDQDSHGFCGWLLRVLRHLQVLTEHVHSDICQRSKSIHPFITSIAPDQFRYMMGLLSFTMVYWQQNTSNTHPLFPVSWTAGHQLWRFPCSLRSAVLTAGKLGPQS